MTPEQKAGLYSNEKWPGVGQIYWRSLIEAAWLSGYADREIERSNDVKQQDFHVKAGETVEIGEEVFPKPSGLLDWVMEDEEFEFDE